MHLYNSGEFFGHKGGKISCSALNTGLYAALLEHPAVSWVSVGQNHRNDFYGTLSGGITLGYGRKSGYGSITDKNLPVGARVFEVSLDGSI